MATPRRRFTPSPGPSDVTRLDVERMAMGGPFDPRWALVYEGAALVEWQTERAAWIAARLSVEVG
jgi:hypothetical protein